VTAAPSVGGYHDLTGKVAIVTGGASGLGREVVDLMSARGAAVIAFDRNADGAEATAEHFADQGRAVVPFTGDVTDPESFADAIALAHQEFGRFNVLHNNAGVELEKHLHETTDEEFDWVMGINLRGVFFGCRAAVNAFRKAGGGGAIVNTTSVAAHAGISSVAAYCASKAALLTLTQSIADGYAAEGIRANCVSPGEMETPMLKQFLDAAPDPAAAREELLKSYPANRFAHPSEVAKAVVFLASDDAAFINGTVLAVDGGLAARCY
jgi:NAD(P)-dependent dehydrogenase (short-subunit alcohol dehydrogenase family)